MTTEQLTLDDGIAILRRRWILLVSLTLVGAGLGYVATRVLPKRYTSQTVVLVEQPKIPGDYVRPVVTDDINERLATMQQEILSPTRLKPIIHQFGLYSQDIDRVPIEDLVGRLQGAVSVTPVQAMAETQSQGLPGFTVSVSFADPHMAQQICSTITSMFMEENSKLRQLRTEQTSDFLAKQLVDAKSKLDGQDARLADFKRRYLGTLPDEEQTNLNVLTGLTSQLDAATQVLSRAQQDKSFAESMLAQQMAAWQAGQNVQDPDTLELQLRALQAQLATLRSKYTDDYPDVIKVKNDIANVRKRIADSGQPSEETAQTDIPTKTPGEPAQIQNLRAQINQHEIDIKEKTAQQDQIQKQIELYQARVQSSPAVEQEYKSLTRDYQTALDFYNDLLRKRDQSAMATDLEHSQEGEQFLVLDEANLPVSPSFPKKSAFIPGGLAGGLALGLGLSLFLEFRDTSLRSEKDVEVLLRLPVLAMVPLVKPDLAKKTAGSSLGVIMRA